MTERMPAGPPLAETQTPVEIPELPYLDEFIADQSETTEPVTNDVRHEDELRPSDVYHAGVAGLSEKRAEWARGRLEKMNHKKSLYASAGARALDGTVEMDVVRPVSLSERFMERRIYKQSLKKSKADLAAYSAEQDFGKGANVPLGMSRSERKDAKKDIRHLYRAGELTAAEASIAKLKVDGSPLRLGEDHVKRTAKRSTRAEKRAIRAVEQPVLNKWRQWRAEEAGKDILRHTARAEKHRGLHSTATGHESPHIDLRDIEMPDSPPTYGGAIDWSGFDAREGPRDYSDLPAIDWSGVETASESEIDTYIYTARAIDRASEWMFDDIKDTTDSLLERAINEDKAAGRGTDKLVKRAEIEKQVTDSVIADYFDIDEDQLDKVPKAAMKQLLDKLDSLKKTKAPAAKQAVATPETAAEAETLVVKSPARIALEKLQAAEEVLQEKPSTKRKPAPAKKPAQKKPPQKQASKSSRAETYDDVLKFAPNA